MNHLKVGKRVQTGEARREKSSKRPQRQPCIQELTMELSPERVRIRLWLLCLQQEGAKRFSGHSYRSGQYELQLSLETWAGTQHRDAATIVSWLAFQTNRQS